MEKYFQKREKGDSFPFPSEVRLFQENMASINGYIILKTGVDVQQERYRPSVKHTKTRNRQQRQRSSANYK